MKSGIEDIIASFHKYYVKMYTSLFNNTDIIIQIVMEAYL